MKPLTAPLLQQTVAEWMRHTFPESVIPDQRERGLRFCEEALEPVQSLGVTGTDVLHLADYVLDRDAGTPEKEVGDALITLATLCNAQGVPMNIAFLERMQGNWRNADATRAKHEYKTTRGAAARGRGAWVMIGGTAAANEFTPAARDPDIDRFCCSTANPVHVPTQRGRARSETEETLPFSPRTNPADGGAPAIAAPPCSWWAAV